MAVAAGLFYAVGFFVLTWPAVLRFRTHWFADEVDGLQNVWNLWWVNYAVTVLHQNPWQTTYLHYPYGTSLVAHTLNPFNGFVAIPLSRVLSPLVVHNLIVTFGFVVGGVTAFLLAYELTRSYAASLLGGFVFTFSSFHFAHAEGHLQLVSLEWIPLFVLLWLKLVRRPRVAIAAAAALVLFLVILCDYYYFLYCVIAGAIILAWAVYRRGVTAFLDSGALRAFGVFAAVALATSGVLAAALILGNVRDPLTGAHSAREFSLDLLGPFIYGAHWRFGELTRRYWIRLPANAHESSVHLGFSVLALAAYAWHRRRDLDDRIALFAFVLGFFLVFAWGPTPQLAGKAILGNRAVLPYAWFESAVPALAVSGVPIRMMVMVTLSAAMLAACGLARLRRGSPPQRAAAAAAVCFMLVEYWPKPIPTLSPSIPRYVDAVRDLPGNDGVIDTVSTPSFAMLYQTIHHKPLAFGYLARVPESVAERDRAVETLLHDRSEQLWQDYRLRYIVSRERAAREWPDTTAVWSDGEVAIVDLSTAGRSSPPRVP